MDVPFGNPWDWVRDRIRFSGSGEAIDDLDRIGATGILGRIGRAPSEKVPQRRNMPAAGAVPADSAVRLATPEGGILGVSPRLSDSAQILPTSNWAIAPMRAPVLPEPGAASGYSLVQSGKPILHQAVPSLSDKQAAISAQIPEAMWSKKDWDNPQNRKQEIDDAIKQWGFNRQGRPVRYIPLLGPHDPMGETRPDTGVQLNDTAFTGSYGNFIATLAHEMGVHLTQIAEGSFASVGPGHAMNEVEAYDEDAKSADSYHLTDGEKAQITIDRRPYYDQLDPENRARVDRGIYMPHK